MTARVHTRKHDYIHYWFLVKHSLKETQNTHEHREAFLYNAAIMAIITTEALLNDLSEQYLPTDIFEKLDSELNLKNRTRNMIEHLTGQYGEFTLPEEIKKRDCHIKKIALGNLFKSKEWNDYCQLIKIRNKITHRRTENEECLEGTKIEMRKKWRINTEEIPELIKSLKNFYKLIEKLLSQSIHDYLDIRLINKFEFHKK